ncbi:MAG TPA: hypothetical protein VGR28_04860 [Candidatus Thermoplasmatota archaeon]|jgi:hypothetical protein|nr:hypothetical protein [Candidatus Thermoplasmatota archaeon]
MRWIVALLALSVLATAGIGMAPPGPPGEFPGPGDFPGQAPDLPDGACDHFPDGDLPASGSVPDWVGLPGCPE